MRGRSPKLNWTECLGQFTTCIRGKRYKLGPDKKATEQQFHFLMQQDGKINAAVDPNPPFAFVANEWLKFVKVAHSPERLRLCWDRIEEFVSFIGIGTRVMELRAAHVENWLASKTDVTKPGTERLYKAMILAPLNWATRPKQTGGGGLIPRNPLKGQLKLPESDSRGGEAVWSEETYRQVLKHANPAFGNVVRILRWTGCRPNLVCKAEAGHYNAITKTWDVADLYIGNSKKGIKRVWLPPQAQELVVRLNKANREGPIFLNGFGGPWNPDALQIYLYNMLHKYQATKDLAWPKGLCVYGLRRSRQFCAHGGTA